MRPSKSVNKWNLVRYTLNKTLTRQNVTFSCHVIDKKIQQQIHNERQEVPHYVKKAGFGQTL